ncbi:LLM class flavin-dependent oxidoreductase [Paenibacillus sp. IITD108]|uniref:LLM class flavin-dependent oxidoreductase n=1 Tax=Paenibacillus sp. IITD108 TaxID=3116649 RepID=UPI002F41CB9B
MEKIQLYSSLPPHNSSKDYLSDVINIARLSEQSGFDGLLLFTNHHVLDPWVMASVVLSNTEKLIPLIAAQPYMLPPFTAAKMIQSLNYLYNRRININLLSGSRESELKEVNAMLADKSARFNRLEEYTTILREILVSKLPVVYEGEYYKLQGLHISPIITEEQMPVFFVAGNSSEAISSAQKYGDVTLFRPEPFNIFEKFYVEKIMGSKIRIAIRISIITRPTSAEAWDVAESRFPSDKDGLTRTRVRKNSSASNTRTMANLALKQEVYDDVFWMGAFLRGKSSDPYLVGSYEEVALYLAQYINLGVKILLIGDLFSEEQFYHFNNMWECLWINRHSSEFQENGF